MTDGEVLIAQPGVARHVAATDPHPGYVLESLLDAKGDLIAASADNTPAKLTVGADDTILMADSAQAAGLKWVASASPSAVGTAAATGTADTFTRGDHVHAHEAAHVAHDTVWAAKGDLLAGTANDTAAVVTVGADDTVLMADAAQSAGVKWVASQTPVTQAFGDAAAQGTADTYARGDHKHGMPADPTATTYRYAVDGWYLNNANGTAGPTQLTRVNDSGSISDNGNAWIAPRAGSVVGIAVHSNAARTAGTLTMTLRIGAVAQALTAVLDGTNVSFKATTGSIALAAGDVVDVTYTTVSWTPITADLRVCIEVLA